MNPDRNALKAGMFILISLVLAVVAIVLIRGEGAGQIAIRTATFRLTDDLGGLSVGDDVRIGGVKVGTVREISFDGLESPAPRVLVKFSIPARYALHQNTEIGLQASLTGSPNINITSLGNGDLLKDRDTLTGSPDAKTEILTSLRETAPKLRETVTAFKQTADSANIFVQHVNGKVDSAIVKYTGVADRATEAMGQVRDVIGDSKTDIRGTLKNLNLTTATLRDNAPPILAKVTSVLEKVDGAMVRATSALDDLQKSSANIKDVSASARSILVDNRSKIDTLVKSLKVTSDNLKAMSVEVRHSPWRLLYKPTPDEMANLNLFDSTREFSEGAGSLSDAAEALRDALHDPNVDKPQVQKLMNNLDQSFKQFHIAENRLWKQVKD